MRPVPATLLFIFLLGLLSCSSGKHPEIGSGTADEPVVPATKENFPTGQLIENIRCKNDTSQHYALYLPAAYSPEKKYPVVFAFDPHGTGTLPVSSYKELAEKYQYIIAGSNNSKNGTSWEAIQKIAAQFFADVQNRCHVNPQRIYLLGFSGGARIANAITMNNGTIAGVICCGAAAPAAASANPRNNYFFMAIAGNEDFNYTEIRKYDRVDLAGHPIKHALLIFNGKHAWPPVATMDEAFLWMELNEMRRNAASKNDTLITEAVQRSTKQLQAYMQTKQPVNAYECCRKTINFYDGLTDLSLFFDTYKTLQSNKEIDRALKEEEAEWAREEKLKKKYAEAVRSNDYNWWQKDIASLKTKIKNSSEREVHLYNRVLGYLSLMMYMQTAAFIQQSNMEAAVYFSKLYLLVDPVNPEAHYLGAELAAIQGNTEEAMLALKHAVKNGYNDHLRLERDSAFRNMKTRAEFQKLLTGMKKEP